MKIEKLTDADFDSPHANNLEHGELATSSGCATNSLQITDIKPAIKDQNRVNVFIDAKFSFSLDISQLTDHPLKIGQQLSPEELADLHQLSDFGKLYIRTLEYTLSRPHSEKEIRDYLKKKTTPQNIRVKNPKTGEWQTKPKKVYSSNLIPPVLARLTQKGHIDDQKFATYLIENYHRSKGASTRRLEQELRKKGISSQIIQETLSEAPRDDAAEIQKIITKKHSKYANDPQKLIQYLVRQGFDYELSSTQVRQMDSQN